MGEHSTSSRGEIGRGFLLITGAKIWFLATATLTTLLFPRLFGDAVAFGRFRVVSAVLNVVTMVVVTATVQAASRLASEALADLRLVRRAGLKVQTVVFLPLFLVMFALAGPISSGILHDPAIESPLRVASVVVAAYAYYALLVGILNGCRRFAAQAALDATFSTLKTGLMVAAVALTASATWAFAGFAATAVTVLAIAAVLARLPAPREPASTGAASPPDKRYARYLLPLAAYALVLNLLLQADVVAVKAALGLAISLGGDVSAGSAAADSASFAAGVFGAAKNAALLPYQVVIALTFVVFPLVSRSMSEGDREAAGRAAGGALRLASLLSFAAVAAFGAAPADLLAFLFGSPYAEAAAALPVLLVGTSLTALMYVGNAVLASAGHPSASLAGAGVAVATQAVGLAVLLPGRSPADVHVPAAVATTIGTAVGAGTTLWMLGRVTPPSAWLRTLAASVIAAAAGITAGDGLAGTLPWPLLCALSTAVYAACVVALGGAGAADVTRVRSLLLRKPPPPDGSGGAGGITGESGRGPR